MEKKYIAPMSMLVNISTESIIALSNGNNNTVAFGGTITDESQFATNSHNIWDGWESDND